MVVMAAVGPRFTTIFGGSVFGPSLRACMMVVVMGPSLTTIFGRSVFGPSPRTCMMVVAVGSSFNTILGGGVFVPMPMPMPTGRWNFGFRGNARLGGFSFIKTALVRAVTAG